MENTKRTSIRLPLLHVLLLVLFVHEFGCNSLQAPMMEAALLEQPQSVDVNGSDAQTGETLHTILDIKADCVPFGGLCYAADQCCSKRCLTYLARCVS